jgi:hypothetical protein
MSFLQSTAIFPSDWIKECIATYTKDHGKEPKLLVLNEEDYLEYSINGTMSKNLGVKVTCAPYLKRGEIDLAMGIKEGN